LFYEKVPYLNSRLPRGAGLPGAANWGSLFSRSSEARLPRSEVEPWVDLEPFFNSPGVQKEKKLQQLTIILSNLDSLVEEAQRDLRWKSQRRF
jgi:hypothetical protein